MSKPIDYTRFEWIGLHKLLRVITIEATVINDEPIRIGAGPGKAVFEPVDQVVFKITDMRTSTSMPAIPGSSWKGLFRSTATSISRIHGLDVCDGVPRGYLCLKGKEFDAIEKSAPVNEDIAKIRAIITATLRVCLLCLMFGSPGISSHVHFYDSLPKGDYKLGYKTGVAINRRTGAAQPGMLFTVEYVEPGCKFSFKMRCENLPNYALGLLVEVVDLLNAGVVKVGGLKSRGFGAVHFEDLKISVHSPVQEKYGVVNGALRGLDPLDEDVKWPSSGLVVEGSDATSLLGDFIKCWRASLARLKRVSDNGWKWEVALSEL